MGRIGQKRNNFVSVKYPRYTGKMQYAQIAAFFRANACSHVHGAGRAVYIEVRYT